MAQRNVYFYNAYIYLNDIQSHTASYDVTAWNQNNTNEIASGKTTNNISTTVKLVVTTSTTITIYITPPETPSNYTFSKVVCRTKNVSGPNFDGAYSATIPSGTTDFNIAFDFYYTSSTPSTYTLYHTWEAYDYNGTYINEYEASLPNQTTTSKTGTHHFPFYDDSSIPNNGSFNGWVSSSGTTPSTTVLFTQFGTTEKIYAVIKYPHQLIGYLTLNGGSLPEGTSTTIIKTDHSYSSDGIDTKSVTISLPTPTRNGYTFLGWKESNTQQLYTQSYSVNIFKGLTVECYFTAQWKKVVTFSMTFNTSTSLDGGTGTITEPSLLTSELVLTPEQYDAYENFDMWVPAPIGDTPIKTGYFFNGWKCEGKTLPATIPVTKPAWIKTEDYEGSKTFNIVAQWIPREWKATLNYTSTETGPTGIQNLPGQQSQSYTYNGALPENASFDSNNESVTFSFIVSSQKPTATNNYHFVKWVDSNGNAITSPILITVNKNSSSYSSTASKTLYANWRQGAIAWIFNGSEWVQATPWIFNGSTWVQAIPHIYCDSGKKDNQGNPIYEWR